MDQNNALAKVIQNGYGVVPFGTRLPRFPIEKYKAHKNQDDIIAYPVNQWLAVQMHNSMDLGGFICFHGECCEDFDTPSAKMGTLLLKYLRPDARTPEDLQFYVHSLGYGNYDNLVKIGEEQGMEQDKISCSDEQWQKITFIGKGKSIWRDNPTLTSFVQEKAPGLLKWILPIMARKIDRKDYLKNRPEGKAVPNSAPEETPPPPMPDQPETTSSEVHDPRESISGMLKECVHSANPGIDLAHPDVFQEAFNSLCMKVTGVLAPEDISSQMLPYAYKMVRDYWLKNVTK